ncbi:MAG: prolyl oligopeptidase family serine peptidase [Bacteroidetes bacterium]|nr:prolyl oligopeptidase family serine peptidase [Bacteroidota bacterium]
MKYFIILIGIISLTSCRSALTADDTKKQWGNFELNQTLKYELVDITKTPVFKNISEKGLLKNEYNYLNKINIYSCVHFSDSLYVTGLIVAPKEDGKFPCVMFNRGGNQDLGSLTVATAVEYMAPLAANGYVVAATNYRGSPGSEGKDEFGGQDVNDVVNLMNSLSEFKQADTGKIGLFGVSRGGMMAYLTQLNCKRAKSIVTIGGITDLFELMEFRPEFGTEVYKPLIPNYSIDKSGVLKQRSAFYLADKLGASAPVLILHGGADGKVPCEQSKKMAKKLNDLSIENKLVIYDNDDHGLNNNKGAAFAEILEWFDRTLKK